MRTHINDFEYSKMINRLFKLFALNQAERDRDENVEDIESDKYLSTKKWEWSYLRVRLLYI